MLNQARIGIGILSFAHGHVNAYAERIRQFDDAQLIACWDSDESRGKRQAAHFGIPYSPHLEDVLNRKDIDCVIIASETNRHADLAVAALEAGKAVFLQKPMAITLADCDRIIAAVERSGCWFSMAFQMRCDPQNIRMKQLVEEGAVGRVGTIRRRHCIPVLFDKNFVEGPTRWHILRETNFGMFFDDATHALDWLVWMLGKPPVSVIAEIDNVLTHVAPDDTGVAIYRYEDGLFAEVYNSSVTLAGENTTEIYGDRGVIIQNHGDAPSAMIKPPHPIGVKLYQRDKAELGWQDLGLPIPASHGERIAGVARPFIDAFKSGKPLCTAQEGRLSVEMCLAAYKAAETGQRVFFPFSG
ncbi:MAG TPA: Gfo/Idh/MocA family oxidoreductase [Chthonomonas sp.]|uniref:Gfo/Idh/MocA family protein n=1 Tax=Chthonomonas sp. TaxID=2282153 RepID=UPI002B4AF911|nr:Gfo/Idh/MocA family oxidoreductase [Chthonomonas sp.]HLI49099.1 Gfo/Idh/MocA family oxidoreductase [Chthonomonas sp.]